MIAVLQNKSMDVIEALITQFDSFRRIRSAKAGSARKYGSALVSLRLRRGARSRNGKYCMSREGDSMLRLGKKIEEIVKKRLNEIQDIVS